MSCGEKQPETDSPEMKITSEVWQVPMKSVANVNKALGAASKMVRIGNRVVFDTSGSHIENKMTKDILWLLERDGVHVVDMMVVPPGREQTSKPPFGRPGV